jgi:hypothetical protein
MKTGANGKKLVWTTKNFIDTIADQTNKRYREVRLDCDDTVWGISVAV